MTDPSGFGAQPRRVSGTRWALTALVTLVVIALLTSLASFVYPWLVAYGLIG